MSLLLVGLGGFLGAVSRALLGAWIQTWSGASLPVGTLGVNTLGCLGIGVAASLLAGPTGDPSPARDLLILGFLGGFTTWSSFGLESVQLLAQGRTGPFLVHLGGHLGLGLGGVALGLGLGRWLR